jgi:formate-dependent nitrite reductase membrane component NrfD
MKTRFEAQSDWGWNIAAYLFLAGVGAGAYLAGAVAGFFELNALSKAGVVLGFPCVFVGTLFLIADLGVKPRALRAFMNPSTSWIARGTYIISAFMILAAIHVATWIWPFRWLGEPEMTLVRFALSGGNIVFAALTMVYTGILLGASRAIAIWSTAMLPLLFLVSATSTGIMATTLLLSISDVVFRVSNESQIIALAKIDALIIAVELIVIIFYLQAMHRTVESRASASMILDGKLATWFWGLVVVIGLCLPLLLLMFKIAGVFPRGMPLSGRLFLSVVISLSGLAGGLVLRYVILAAGVRAPIKAAGIEFAIPTCKNNC